MKISFKKKLAKLLPEAAFLRLRAMRNQRRKSLSQIGQDFWVFGEVFNGKKGGFFLEIGSADGISLSNTFLLEKRFGWKGICIEANPDAFRILRQVRSAKCINICVDEAEGEVTFSADGLLGGIVDPSLGPVGGGPSDVKVIRMRARPLVSILQEEQAPKVIDYLSIDVEGVEERVLSKFPFSEYRFRALTIERPSDKLRGVLKENGYLVVKEIPGMDCFYIHEEFSAEYEKNAFEFWGRSRA